MAKPFRLAVYFSKRSDSSASSLFVFFVLRFSMYHDSGLNLLVVGFVRYNIVSARIGDLRLRKKEWDMEQYVRVRISCALNFVLPGFGICFSGIIHKLVWLLCLGLGMSVAHLMFGPRFLATYNLYVLFTSNCTSEILDSVRILAISFIVAFLGAVVESNIRDSRQLWYRLPSLHS